MRDSIAMAAVATAAVVGVAVATFGNAPVCEADTDVVFIGGTGTGLVPFEPKVGKGFTALVPDADDATSVLYDGAPWANPHAGVPKAQAVIAAQDNPVAVIGLSKGAQVARATERLDLNPTSRYVLVLDPDDDNGLSRRFGFSAPKTEFTHDVTIITAEYDMVSDFPDRPLNLLAVANSGAAWAWGHNQAGDGSDLDPLTRLDEAKVTETVNPNGTTTTRKLIPTHALPLTHPLRQMGIDTTELDKHLRPMIDAGYSRNDKKTDNREDNDDANETGSALSSAKASGAGSDSDSDPGADSDSASSSAAGES